MWDTAQCQKETYLVFLSWDEESTIITRGAGRLWAAEPWDVSLPATLPSLACQEHLAQAYKRLGRLSFWPTAPLWLAGFGGFGGGHRLAAGCATNTAASVLEKCACCREVGPASGRCHTEVMLTYAFLHAVIELPIFLEASAAMAVTSFQWPFEPRTPQYVAPLLGAPSL